MDLSLEDKEEHVFITIKDHGKGIPQEILDKVGQPFFTTKENGTGLGLMVTMKIIENHGGSFFIKGVENSGTTVKIILPKNE
nr:HAMP domain-containing sensor histidine kinase [Bacillus sp. FJAT-45066]